MEKSLLGSYKALCQTVHGTPLCRLWPKQASCCYRMGKSSPGACSTRPCPRIWTLKKKGFSRLCNCNSSTAGPEDDDGLCLGLTFPWSAFWRSSWRIRRCSLALPWLYICTCAPKTDYEKKSNHWAHGWNDYCNFCWACWACTRLAVATNLRGGAGSSLRGAWDMEGFVHGRWGAGTKSERTRKRCCKGWAIWWATLSPLEASLTTTVAIPLHLCCCCWPYSLCCCSFSDAVQDSIELAPAAKFSKFPAESSPAAEPCSFQKMQLTFFP